MDVSVPLQLPPLHTLTVPKPKAIQSTENERALVPFNAETTAGLLLFQQNTGPEEDCVGVIQPTLPK
jgi:hypothetical protein